MKHIFSSRRNKNPHNNEKAEKKEGSFFSKETRAPFFNANNGAVQAKLTVGQPGDKYEKEADRMADAVVNNSSKPDIQNKEISSIQRESLATPQEDEKSGTAEQRMKEDKLVQEKPEIQRMENPEEDMINKMDAPEEKEGMINKMDQQEEEMPVQKMETQEEEMVNKVEEPEEEAVQKMEGEEEEPVQKKGEEKEEIQAKANEGNQTAGKELSQQIKNKSGKGKPLPKDTQAEMESSFGRDFSDVNIHTGQDAVQMNKELGAQAFTHGKDIYFNSGKFNPETNKGKHLLAHELTHTIQQSKDIDQVQRQQREIPTRDADRDGCRTHYRGINSRPREIHLNLRHNSVRIYTKRNRGYSMREFSGLITGPATRGMVGCDMHRITRKAPGPTSLGLLNFVVFCPGREIGFHSHMWRPRRNGARVRTRRPIPGNVSHGCARIPHNVSRAFYNAVSEGDCVRVYSQSRYWYRPNFARCLTTERCQ